MVTSIARKHIFSSDGVHSTSSVSGDEMRPGLIIPRSQLETSMKKPLPANSQLYPRPAPQTCQVMAETTAHAQLDATMLPLESGQAGRLLHAHECSLRSCQPLLQSPILNILAQDFNVPYETVSRVPTLMQAGLAISMSAKRCFQEEAICSGNDPVHRHYMDWTLHH
jgi:hypothetical protein